MKRQIGDFRRQQARRRLAVRLKRFNCEGRQIPAGFGDELKAAALAGKAMAKDFEHINSLEDAFSRITRDNVSFARFAKSNKAVLRALFGVHLSLGLHPVMDNYQRYHLFKSFGRQQVIGNQYLIESLLSLPEEGRRAVLEAVPKDDPQHPCWLAIYTGAMSVVRIIHTLLDKGDEVFYPKPRTDGKYKIDLLLPQKSGPWVCLQVKGAQKVGSYTFRRKPKMNGFGAPDIQVITSLWRGVRSVNQNYGTNFVGSVIWVPSNYVDRAWLEVDEDIYQEIDAIRKIAKTLR